LTSAFRINGPHVVAETLDGETTIVDLDSGIYYALNESGSLIWDGLIGGAGAKTIAGTLVSAFEIDEASATEAVSALLEELTAAGLIVPATEASSNGSAPASNGAGPAQPKAPFAAPKLSTYTDMQELLLLDPIHEVDEAGWPAQAG
jgi:hypothetical protein